MIVVDIETSGKYTLGYGVWQIGALEFENPENKFLEEARIDDEDKVSEEALKVIGKTEEELRNKNKQSQKELIIHFLDWAEKCKEKMIAGSNVWWDFIFLQNKCLKYGLINEFEDIFAHRVIDLHAVAQFIYKQKNGKFMTKEGNSDMNLTEVLEMCGMKDDRIQVKKGKVVKEGSPHNGLEDAELIAECFRRLLK